MLQRGLLAALVLALLLPTLAAAQKFELTPFLGYRFGGDIDEDADVFIEPFDFELEDSSSSGIILGIEVTRRLQVELIWSRQATTLIEDRGFFGDPEEVFDLDVDYYHAGVSYQWARGQVRPFIAMSLGATELNPDPAGLASETRFSIGLGGGVKLMFTQNLGFRFEGRFLATALGDDGDYCDRRCDDEGSALGQGEVRGGLIFAF